MSIPVELHELAGAAGARAFAYLLTVSEDGRPHAVAVSPVFDGDELVVAAAGRRTSANAAARSNVSLVYPPAGIEEYSLIVDGDATLDGEHVRIRPTWAVLHRPAPPRPDRGAGQCSSDCVPVSLGS